jgi:hypothetical protein
MCKTQEEIDRRRTINLLFQRVEKHLSERISSTTGAESYSAMFELIIGQPLNGLQYVSPIWETICVLFQFRNVLGHGRQVSAEQLKAYYIEGVKETFGGGYRKVQDYLMKKKLLESRFTERHSDFIYLSEAVADHFSAAAASLKDTIVASLEGPDKIAFEEATAAA